MNTLTPVRQKWIASVTCTAAAILAVLAGISQQLLARLVRDWDMLAPAMADHVGLGVIATLFLVVIAVNVILLFRVESENVALLSLFAALAAIAALFMIMTVFGFSILRTFSGCSIAS